MSSSANIESKPIPEAFKTDEVKRIVNKILNEKLLGKKFHKTQIAKNNTKIKLFVEFQENRGSLPMLFS